MEWCMAVLCMIHTKSNSSYIHLVQIGRFLNLFILDKEFQGKMIKVMTASRKVPPGGFGGGRGRGGGGEFGYCRALLHKLTYSFC